MDDREGIEWIGYIKMGSGVSLNAWDFNEAYVGWWERQFCFGRNAVVIVKVKVVAWGVGELDGVYDLPANLRRFMVAVAMREAIDILGQMKSTQL
jgi:hypothetical protein